MRASPDSVRGAELRCGRQTPQPSTHSWCHSLGGEVQGIPPLKQPTNRVFYCEQPLRGCPYHKTFAPLVIVRGTVPRQACLLSQGRGTTRW